MGIGGWGWGRWLGERQQEESGKQVASALVADLNQEQQFRSMRGARAAGRLPMQEGRTPGIARPGDEDHTGRASPALDSRSRWRLRWGRPHAPPAGFTWEQPREGTHGDCDAKTSL